MMRRVWSFLSGSDEPWAWECPECGTRYREGALSPICTEVAKAPEEMDEPPRCWGCAVYFLRAAVPQMEPVEDSE